MLLTMLGISQNISAQIEFIENKGQWDKKIHFRTNAGAGSFFIEEAGFTVLMYHPEDVRAVAEQVHGHKHSDNNAAVKPGFHDKNSEPKDINVLRSHAYKVKFIGGNFSNPVPEKPLPGINNYFIGNDASKWATDCRVYQAVTFKDVYKGIDVRYYSEGPDKLKYDIIVHPGADPSVIKMAYDGVDKLSVKNKELIIGTSVGEVKELYPYSYQASANARKEIDVRYDVKGNEVKFNVKEYDRSAALVIDPALIFASFTGSVSDNWGYTATYGPDGSFFLGGIVFGSNYPTSPGAFQTTWGGGVPESAGTAAGYDIAIMKLSSNGRNRIYATFLGGSHNEQPHSMVVDGQGNLIVAGRSRSGNYPSPIKYGPQGDWDIVVTKLNAAGSALIASAKIGGTGADGVNIRIKTDQAAPVVDVLRRNYGDDARSEVILDGAGNIYLASATQSLDFPVSGAGFGTSFGGGRQDGVLLKFTPGLGQIFSAYLGGIKEDACFVLALHPVSNDIYVAGGTASTNFPGIAGDAIYTGYRGGACDGYVAIVRNDGSSLVRSTYLGTDKDDLVYGIQFDKFAFPYVMGTTTGAWPVLNATYSVPGSSQFIAKLQPELNAFVYSTVFGTGTSTPNISPVAFLVDRCENVYVSGWGGNVNRDGGYPNAGTQGLPTTPNAIKATSDATGSDMYFFVLEKNATRVLYGTFYGQNDNPGGNTFGEHVDGGTSRFDKNGVIYQAICANCMGHPQRYPTTAGVWAETNGSSICNALALKIEMDFTGVAGGIRRTINGVDGDSIGCVPLTVTFSDTLLKAKSYSWNFGDGSPEVKTTNPTIQHTYTSVGRYTVRLIAIDSTTCNVTDTSYTVVRVGDNPAVPSFAFRKLGDCNSLRFSFQNTSTAAIDRFGPNSFVWDFGDGTPKIRMGKDSIVHTFPSAGTYQVRLTIDDSSFCNSPVDTMRLVRISPNVSARFVTPARGCVPYTAEFDNTSLGGLSFFWDFGDGTTSTEENPSHLYSSVGTYNVVLIAYDSTSCNKTDTARFTITVQSIPQARFTFTPTFPIENTFTQFTNTSVGATRYVWDFGDGETSTEANPRYIFNATGTFNVCLRAYNEAGCYDSTCAPVRAIINPLLDVPTAFTPGKFGVNSVVKVFGFGIKEMDWRIYNRWGQLVFQSNHPKAGWDGTFNGKLQPLDVYTYTLDVKFSDGKSLRKTGDITLLK
jgi:gliding motility-associated-like protein